MKSEWKLGIGLSDGQAPAQQLGFILVIALASAFYGVMMYVTFATPGRMTFGAEILLLVFVPMLSAFVLVLMVYQFLGLGYLGRVEVSDRGVAFVSPKGNETLFRWDGADICLSIRDYRERPDNFRHGRPGIFLKPIVTRTNGAWIEEHTVTALLSKAAENGWITKSFHFERNGGDKSWMLHVTDIYRPGRWEKFLSPPLDRRYALL